MDISPATTEPSMGVAGAGAPAPASSGGTRREPPFRRRWLSRRALLLHLEVVLIAPACLAAGWWQATRALAGNGLSWFYSIEWPVFALLAVAGWWVLVHEDPSAYAARKARPPSSPERSADGAVDVPEDAGGAVAVSAAAFPAGEPALPAPRRATVELSSASLARALAGLSAAELALGIAVLALVPFGRPSEVVPRSGAAVFVAHASLGVPLAAGALLYAARTWRSARIARLSGRVGGVGVVLASLGGLLALAHPSRLAGVALMLVGSVTAAIGYLFPTFEQLER